MSGIYSSFNNTTRLATPANFGLSNTVRLSVLSNNGYTSALNTGGLVAPAPATIPSTNVIGALARPTYRIGDVNLNLGNNNDDGGSTNLDVTGVTGYNLPVNSVEGMLNNNSKFSHFNSSALHSFGHGPVIGVSTGVNGISGYN